MKKAFDYANKNKLGVIIFLGDCNARHWSYWDSKFISHGQILYDNLNHLVTILNDGQPNFYSKNGNSVTDFCILQSRINNYNNISLITDDETELFTGAPLRGHVPVIVILHRNVKRIQTITKPWFEKCDWENWSQALEALTESVQFKGDIHRTWDTIKEAIQTATREHIPTKKVYTQNKQFWNKLLTEASKQLRNLRKVFKYKSSPRNDIALEKAKETFKNLLQDSAAYWMREHLGDLGHQKNKSSKKIFCNQRAGVGPVKNQNKEVLTATEDIDMEFKRTFFETRHQQNQFFDDIHFNMVNHNVQKFQKCSQHA